MNKNQTVVKIDLRKEDRLESFVQAFIRHTPESDALNVPKSPETELNEMLSKTMVRDQVEDALEHLRTAVSFARDGDYEIVRLVNDAFLATVAAGKVIARIAPE